jgi:hypothetical protein
LEEKLCKDSERLIILGDILFYFYFFSPLSEEEQVKISELTYNISIIWKMLEKSKFKSFI